MPDQVNLTCPCCGYQTVFCEYDICHVCGWENDFVQRDNPDMTGANRVTLREAQRNFHAFGAADRRLVGTDLINPPAADDIRDPNWTPLEPVRSTAPQ
jgi:hypothetical protein